MCKVKPGFYAIKRTELIETQSADSDKSFKILVQTIAE